VIGLQHYDLLRGPHVAIVRDRQHALGNPKSAVDTLPVNEFVPATHRLLILSSCPAGFDAHA
jgi:hypothetical protein